MGLGFHKESGIANVDMEEALFPAMPGTVPLQLRLAELTQKPPTAKDEQSKESPSTCKSRKKKKKKATTCGAQSVADGSLLQHQEQWPEDVSIACADNTVKKAKQWVIDTFNPNCGIKVAEYLKWTSAGIAMIQEVKVEEEEGREESEDTARGRWVEACGTAVPAR